jgi:hypothetical protein
MRPIIDQHGVFFEPHNESRGQIFSRQIHLAVLSLQFRAGRAYRLMPCRVKANQPPASNSTAVAGSGIGGSTGPGGSDGSEVSYRIRLGRAPDGAAVCKPDGPGAPKSAAWIEPPRVK